MSSLSESCWPLWRKWRIEGCSPTCGQRSSRTCLEVHDEKLTVWCEMYCVNTRFSLTLSPSVMLLIYHPEIYQQPWWKSFICWNVMLKHFCHLVTAHTQQNFVHQCFICVGVYQWDMISAASVFIFTGLNVMDITCNMVERDVIAVPESWKSRASGEIREPRPPETLKLKYSVQTVLRGGGLWEEEEEDAAESLWKHLTTVFQLLQRHWWTNRDDITENIKFCQANVSTMKTIRVWWDVIKLCRFQLTVLFMTLHQVFYWMNMPFPKYGKSLVSFL